MTHQLVARTGPTAGNIYTLDQDEISVGRDLSNDIVINDPEVSRRHVRLLKQGVNYVIEDSGSTNGSLVNGQRITGPHTLYSGEMITLGENITLLYEMEQPAADVDATVVSGMGSDATIRASMPPKSPPPAPAAKPATPAYKPYEPEPVFTPAPVPVEDGFATMPDQPEYGAQVPSQPYSPPPPIKKKFPIWIVILIIILLMICLCVIAAIVVDTMDLYCSTFSFLFDDLLGMCP